MSSQIPSNVEKASPSPPKFLPPPNSLSIDEILATARSHLIRLTPYALQQDMRQNPSGNIQLIDIRPSAQRLLEGSFPPPAEGDLSYNIHVIERNVLEWRLDPQSEARIVDIIDHRGYETPIVVFCSEGYTSSLAAWELQRLGLGRATDLIGGFQGWLRLMKGEYE